MYSIELKEQRLIDAGIITGKETDEELFEKLPSCVKYGQTEYIMVVTTDSSRTNIFFINYYKKYYVDSGSFCSILSGDGYDISHDDKRYNLISALHFIYCHNTNIKPVRFDKYTIRYKDISQVKTVNADLTRKEVIALITSLDAEELCYRCPHYGKQFINVPHIRCSLTYNWDISSFGDIKTEKLLELYNRFKDDLNHHNIINEIVEK